MAEPAGVPRRVAIVLAADGGGGGGCAAPKLLRRPAAISGVTLSVADTGLGLMPPADHAGSGLFSIFVIAGGLGPNSIGKKSAQISTRKSPRNLLDNIISADYVSAEMKNALSFGLCYTLTIIWQGRCANHSFIVVLETALTSRQF